MHADKLFASLALAAASLAVAAEASAYCRTTTCDAANKNAPCSVDPATGCVNEGIPLSWPQQCVGFDLQKDADHGKITLDQATQVAHLAFLSWENAACTADLHPSLRFSDLGPVECSKHEYNPNQANANIIMFRADGWPYAASGNTLALTTVTYNVDSGEIYDADMEINGTVDLTVGSPVAYDLQSIVTHEAGHFIGLAHSKDSTATMFAKYTAGTTDLRVLHADDLKAVCEVYPPGRDTPACDPTPRHGFSSVCSTPTTQPGCCTTAPGRAGTAGGAALAVLGVGIALLGIRRRRP